MPGFLTLVMLFGSGNDSFGLPRSGLLPIGFHGGSRGEQPSTTCLPGAMAPGLSSGTYLIINPFQAPFSFLIFIFPFFPSFFVFLLSLPPFFPSFLLFLLFHDPPYRIGSERSFLNNKWKLFAFGFEA